MRHLLIITTVFALLLSSSAWAARFEFDGTIDFHNDIALIGFSLDSTASNVNVYTDSFNFGLDGNFDPITALWHADGTLIAQNDDISTGAFNWDSGFFLDSLDAGDYFFTVASYNNFAKGTDPSDGSFSQWDEIMMSDGFMLDDDSPVPIEEWALADGMETTGMSGYYHVVLEGVDSAFQEDPDTSATPEPGTLFLLGSGLLGFIGARRKGSGKK